jgi:hypothetical protein
MALTKYTYETGDGGDFPNEVVNLELLEQEINDDAGMPDTLSHVDEGVTAAINVDIWFDPALTGEQETTLDGIVAAHSGHDYGDDKKSINVLDKDLSTPPESPSNRDRYIVGPGATGAWENEDNHIAEYRGSSWRFEVPRTGADVFVEDENLLYIWSGSAWYSTDTQDVHLDIASEIAGIAEKGSPIGGDWLLIEDSAASNVKKKVQVGNLPTAGGGEANTAGNVGTAGVGVFKEKVGIDLKLKKINAASGGKVTITDDTENDEIDIQVVDATTSQKGAVELATDGENAANVVVQGNDSRLSDDRTADGVRTATTVVAVSSATAPTAGQVLKATSGTAATWQDLPSAEIDAQEASSSVVKQTTSSNYVDLLNATLTTSNTSAKKYLVSASFCFDNSTQNETAHFILSIDGVQVADSERDFDIKTAGIHMIGHTQCLTSSLGSGKVIKILYKTSGGTLSVHNNSLIIYGVS